MDHIVSFIDIPRTPSPDEIPVVITVAADVRSTYYQ